MIFGSDENLGVDLMQAIYCLEGIVLKVRYATNFSAEIAFVHLNVQYSTVIFLSIGTVSNMSRTERNK
jgi:hypothetical protein